MKELGPESTRGMAALRIVERDLRQQLAVMTAERDGHLEELTHVRGRAIRAEADRDALVVAARALLAATDKGAK